MGDAATREESWNSNLDIRPRTKERERGPLLRKAEKFFISGEE